jgi:hypothetical protein
MQSLLNEIEYKLNATLDTFKELKVILQISTNDINLSTIKVEIVFNLTTVLK